MILDDLADDRQTQSRSLLAFGDIGLEQLVEIHVRETGAVIGNRNNHKTIINRQ